MIKTKITEMFGIEHPIIQGGMHYVGFAEMASAVANAGGLGIITGLTQKTPDDLANEIAKCHDMTDKPFGVNLTFLPGFQEPDYPGYIEAIIKGGVRIVETAGRSPEAYMPDLKGAGIKVIHKCTSVRHSLKAEKIGCDAVSVDGFECGGHPGEDDIPNMILLPRAAEELSIPFGDDIQITDIIDEVAGVYPKIMQEGTMDAGAWSCGMVAGLIHDVPTCKELVERIVSDAEEIIKSRLSQFVA
jgi:NAD(P)H-dependent flavin oxidoreductase YrpB (nitropropane dioxygenase family)